MTLQRQVQNMKAMNDGDEYTAFAMEESAAEFGLPEDQLRESSYKDQHRNGKEGLDGTTEIAVWKDKPQYGTDVEECAVGKFCNWFQKEKLSVTQESDGLRSEHKELKVNFYELQRKYNALQENMNVIREERDTLQRDKDKLIGLESTLKIILEGGSSVEKAYLILSQERDTLKSEQEEFKVYFDELQRKCCALTDNLNVIKGKCDTLQRERDKLVGMESTLKMILEGGPSIRKAYLLLGQERDTLKSEYEELKANFDVLKRKGSDLTDNLNVISRKCDDLQRDKDKLLGLECRLKMTVDEESSIQEAYLLLAQERDNLRSEQDEFKVDFDELKRVCNTLKENLNIIRGEGDVLQRNKI
ncbi:protein hook isoform X2 [Cryptotermes secundus]|nr:protein hook isoform X2 [Cryptotermes secundus]